MAGQQTGTRDIFVDANGLRHHLVARGSPGSPIVLMLHGLASQAHIFDGIASRLAVGYHVYCLDIRGRGESGWGPPDQYQLGTYADDLEAVRAALGLEHFTLLGTWMGGLVAVQYTQAHPERVAKLVLNDIGPDVDARGLQRIRSYITEAPEAFPDLKAAVRYYQNYYAHMLDGLSADEVEDFVRHNVRKNDIGVYVWKMDPAVRAMLPATPPEDRWDAFRSIDCPILILRTAESDVLSRETAGKMLEANPGCRLVEVPGAGHAPVLTEPEAVTELEAFLAS